jgi:uncharacterized protein YdaU (DUF1376 family)
MSAEGRSRLGCGDHPVNYVSWHLGDYARSAGHLSMQEDAAYRRLLDAYYVRERPLPPDVGECCKLVRASNKAERAAVDYVLGQYFVLTEEGYRQTRADREIAAYRSKQEKARSSANARWGEVGGEGSANALPSHDQGSATCARTHAPARSRPQPPEPNTQAQVVTRERPSTRCPATFVVTEELRAFASAEALRAPHLAIEREESKFRDFEFTRPYTDWDSRYRSWIREAADRSLAASTRQGAAGVDGDRLTFAERDQLNTKLRGGSAALLMTGGVPEPLSNREIRQLQRDEIPLPAGARGHLDVIDMETTAPRTHCLAAEDDRSFVETGMKDSR